MAITNKDLEINIKAKYDSSGTKTATMDLKKFADAAVSSSSVINSSSSKISDGMSGISSILKSVGGSFLNTFSNVARSAIEGVYNMLPSFSAMLAGLATGVYEVAKEFIDVNAEFEKMRVTLDVMTKGHGEEWFSKLRQLALDTALPIEDIVASFRTLVTYEISPTISLMKSFAGIASILPEGGKAIQGIARAMGQIQTKGRLEGQEMRQLAEWGVPAYAIAHKLMSQLAEKTGQDVSKMKYTMISASQALPAIQAALTSKFGAAAEAVANKWGGLYIRLKNYAKEFIAEVGEGGGMDLLEGKFKKFIKFLSDSFKSGEFQATARFIGETLTASFQLFFDLFKFDTSQAWIDIWITGLKSIIYLTAYLHNEFSFLKEVFLAIKEVWLGWTLLVNVGILAIVGVVDMVVNGFKSLVNLIPTIVPGIKEARAAFASWGKTVDALVTQQGKAVWAIGHNMYTTGEEIVKTGKAMGDSYAYAEIAVLKLDTSLKRFEINRRTGAFKPKDTGEPPTGQPPPPPDEEEWKKIWRFKLEAMKGKGLEFTNTLFDNADMEQKIQIVMNLWEAGQMKVLKGPIAKAFKDWVNSLQNGFSDVYSNIIKGNLTLAESFTSFGKVIREAFIKSLSEMLASWTIMKAKMLITHLTAERTMTASTAAGEAHRLLLMHGPAKEDLIFKTKKVLTHASTEASMTGATALGEGHRLLLASTAAHEGLILNAPKLATHLATETAMTTATVVGEESRTAIVATAAHESLLIRVAYAIKRMTIDAYEALAGAIAGSSWLGPFGIVAGMVAGVAAMALILSYVSKIAGFETGTGLTGVPSTGPAIVHKGEIIMNKKESDMFRTMMQGNKGASGSNVNLNFTISAMDSDSLEHIVRKKVIPLIRDNIKDFGKGRTMVKEAFA